MLSRWTNCDDRYDDDYGPILVLNDEVSNFYDISIDDFKMIDYEPMGPQLKLELGI